MSYAAAYQRTLTETENPRQIERRLMARITGDLERHLSAYAAADDLAARLEVLANGLGQAIWENQRLWLNFVSDLSEPENALPPQLRAGLISIGLWVERHSQQVLRGMADPRPLVEVNQNIVNGLAGIGASPRLAEEA